MALYDFVYLNTTTLAGYAAQVDGGLIAETKTRRTRKGTGGANFGLGPLGVKAEGGRENEHSQTFSVPLKRSSSDSLLPRMPTLTLSAGLMCLSQTPALDRRN